MFKQLFAPSRRLDRFLSVGPSFGIPAKVNSIQQVRFSSLDYGVRINRQAPFFVIVPHAERWIVERFGRFHRTLESGLHIVIPLIEKIAYKHMSKEIPLVISEQSAITKDNVIIDIDGILFYRVNDPYKASYEIENPAFAISNLAQTTMRAEIGKLTLDRTFSERQMLNQLIVEGLARACEGWGVTVERYEIRNIKIPLEIKKAMQLEAEAERKKRKTILDSEAEKQSLENVALGRKRATELVSEADMIQEINVAKGEAQALEAKAGAAAKAIKMISDAIVNSKAGEKAVAFRLAEEYIRQFGKLAKESNTLVIPSNVSDASSIIAQAATVFNKVYNNTRNNNLSTGGAVKATVDGLHSDNPFIEQELSRISPEAGLSGIEDVDLGDYSGNLKDLKK